MRSGRHRARLQENAAPREPAAGSDTIRRFEERVIPCANRDAASSEAARQQRLETDDAVWIYVQLDGGWVAKRTPRDILSVPRAGRGHLDAGQPFERRTIACTSRGNAKAVARQEQANEKADAYWVHLKVNGQWVARRMRRRSRSELAANLLWGNFFSPGAYQDNYYSDE
jgi:hypothetical protein